MKKITLLMAFVACIAFVKAQDNLIVNPSFETWADGKPTGWVFDKTTATLSQEASIVKSGTSALKVVTTATYWITQNIPVTAGKTYTLKLSYYIASGDGTDFRIWSNFFNGTPAAATWHTMSLADSVALKGPGGNLTTAYFPNEVGAWKSYTYDVVAPQNFTNFSFQVRTYTGSTIYLDDFSFMEKTTGLNTPTDTKLQAIVSGKNLLIKNVADGAEVEIFSTVGSKVQSSVIENGKVSIASLNGGLYVVRSGKLTQKIRL